MEAIVLRYGHRLLRDERVTSHAALVARAFGAKKMIYTYDRDESLERSIEGICREWGGSFKIEFEKDWRKVINRYKDFCKVHLTMYGLPLNKVFDEIKKKDKILVIIGSQKVPAEIYRAADYNVSITLQPHSEIAALAVFLYKLFGDSIFEKEFKNAKRKIVPMAHGKKVLHLV
ncbi:MAG: tRNA (cytidine(56)-2'-O)-methyltransferase [Candidatus Iainarchaeum archaeon]|uniref:tRNA (cytidine(56)-2'-O)-methyltransferase n=1 Tax=Candidatus Iainarchaeum sp. TaxID=3101447 RepID=A0A497JL11_9ARCH|nr:MAG: tRNA (cytidine(56)-2'-O)-methyltransferase [Candidatus Diapherotrites archaeon]